ncbi:MAG TPA: hypothetical protein PKK05_27615, partial [Leptospiraceae bacterium]|nr:hypothetical protein [Leptospiraceae bacterium]
MIRKKLAYGLLIFSSIFLFRSDLHLQEANTAPAKDDEDAKHNKNAGKLSQGRDGKEYFTADWRNAELKDFLKGMSAIVKKNILIDDSIKGKKI